MRLRKKSLDEYWQIYIFPALLWIIFVAVFPVLYNLYLGFFDIGAGGKLSFVGIDNYKDIFSSPIFHKVLLNTVIWTIGIMLGLLVISLGLSILLNQQLKGETVYRIIFFLPWVIPGVVAGIVWEYMLNPSWEIINRLLCDIGLIDAYFPWLGTTETSLFSVMMVYIWRVSPFSIVMFLAGLQSIPEELYESAQIDGANGFQQFLFITIPQLLPVIKVVMLLLTIWTFNSFDITYALTQGGPLYSSEILAMRIYLYGFKLNQFGLAAAASNFALVITFIIALKYLKSMDT